jgi:hypothetical protein
VAASQPGPVWLVSARIACAAGRRAEGKEWLRRACLEAPIELRPEAAPLQRCGLPPLEAAPDPPGLPKPIQALWGAAESLELEPPIAPWAAVIGEIDGLLAPAPANLDPAADAESSGGWPSAAARSTAGAASDTDAPEPPAKSAPDAFLAALRAARHARLRDGARRPDLCSDRELRARRRMQRIAPRLLTRYLHRLAGSLVP